MDTSQIGMVVDQFFARYVGLSLISSAPFVIVFFQTALAIREHIIRVRPGYNSEDEDYVMLKWISIVMSYIGVFQFIIGIGLFIKSL